MNLPWQPLADLAARRGWSTSELAEQTNTPRRSIHRWAAAGTLSERSADRVAVALGLVLRDLWPEHVEASWEAAEAARRAKRNARERARMATNPDLRARKAEAQRRWRAKSQRAVVVKRRLYQSRPEVKATRAAWVREWNARTNHAAARRARYATDPEYRERRKAQSRAAQQRRLLQAAGGGQGEGLHLLGPREDPVDYKEVNPGHAAMDFGAQLPGARRPGQDDNANARGDLLHAQGAHTPAADACCTAERAS